MKNDTNALEYEILWEKGDLGLSMNRRLDSENSFTMSNSIGGIQVSRVTGKGAPKGIKHVRTGDALLCINDVDVVDASVEEISRMLKDNAFPKRLTFERSRDKASMMTLRSVNSESFNSVHGVHSLTENANAALKSYQIFAIAREGHVGRFYELLQSMGQEILYYKEVNHGQCPIHVAARFEQIELVEAICNEAVDVKQMLGMTDTKGNTVLHFAATKSVEMVKLLLDFGCDVNVLNTLGSSPLSCALLTMRVDDAKIPNLLLRHHAALENPLETNSVLHVAIDRKMYTAACVLIEFGARMILEDEDGRNVFEKLPKGILRLLISFIRVPQDVVVQTKIRNYCMLCKSISSFWNKLSNCYHCGRLCCKPCASLTMEIYKFPIQFPGRLTSGASASKKKKKVCKTCYNILKQRHLDSMQRHVPVQTFYGSTFGTEWNEVNPDKQKRVLVAQRNKI